MEILRQRGQPRRLEFQVLYSPTEVVGRDVEEEDPSSARRKPPNEQATTGASSDPELARVWIPEPILRLGIPRIQQRRRTKQRGKVVTKDSGMQFDAITKYFHKEFKRIP